MTILSEIGFDMSKWPTEKHYRLVKYGENYVRQAMNDYENAYRIKLTKGLAMKAAELGYKLVPNASPV